MWKLSVLVWQLLLRSKHFPDSSVGKESTCNAGDPSSIPGSGEICWRRDRLPTPVFLGFPCGSAGKESTCSVGDLGSIPGLGRSPGEGKGYPIPYSGLENPKDCIVHWLQRVGHDWATFTFTRGPKLSQNKKKKFYFRVEIRKILLFNIYLFETIVFLLLWNSCSCSIFSSLWLLVAEMRLCEGWRTIDGISEPYLCHLNNWMIKDT